MKLDEKTIIKQYQKFIKESKVERKKIVNKNLDTVAKMHKTLSNIDKAVEETKQATIKSLKILLHLDDGDMVKMFEDGSYEIIKEGVNKMAEPKIVLNGKEISKEQLEEQKKAIENQKGAKLVETSPNNYKLLLQD